MSEGWCADPDDPASLRWWDGTAWTGHRHPAPTAASAAQDDHDVVVRVEGGTGMREPLVVTTDRLVIGDETFLLADLDSVQ